MARPRSFTEDELIALINEYYLEYPNRMIKTQTLSDMQGLMDALISGRIPFDAVQKLNNILTKSTPVIR